MADPVPGPVPAPDNGDPAPIPDAVEMERTAGPPGVPTPTDPNKFFKGAKAMDRLKGYLKEVPVLHARLVKVIEQQETNLKTAQESLASFDKVTEEIKATVAKWEEDEAKKETVGGGTQS